MIEDLLKILSAQHPTYGFQKLFDLIRIKNYSFNHKRVYRIYCDLRLITLKRITRWLDQLASSSGYPNRIRVDNGPENISYHFQSWAKAHSIFIQCIQPGKPAQNAYIERFNRSYREAVLDMYLFR